MHTDNSKGAALAQSNSYDIADWLEPVGIFPITNRALAVLLAKDGRPVFPCGPDKRPLTARGFLEATRDLEQIARWWTNNPNALVGLPTGARSGLAVLDLDKHHVGQDGEAALRAFGFEPDTLSPRVISTPSGGKHLYFRWHAGLTNSRSHLPPGIDVRGEGGYVIAPGTMLPDGRRYGGDPTFTGLPAWPAALLPPNRDDLSLDSLLRSEPSSVEWGKIERALAAIPPDCDYDTWTRIGMGIHHESEGSETGFDHWNSWSALGAKYKAREMRGHWKSFGRKNGVTIATVFHIAAENGWSGGIHVGADDFDDLADLPDAPGPSWKSLLAYTDTGTIKSNPHNVDLIIKNDPRLFGVFGFNDLLGKTEIVRAPLVIKGKPGRKPARNLTGAHWKRGAREDVHDADIRTLLSAPAAQTGYAFTPTSADVTAAVDSCARDGHFHPVQDRIASIKWDGIERAETLFVDYLGCPNTPYHHQAARLALLGAVTRIYEPGHKFDCMPILEGAQGIRKSTFVKELGMDWSGDPTITDWSDPKKILEQISGIWIVEIPELSSMSRADIGDLKAAISRTHDKGRLAYAHHEVTVPRQCIFIGTTNDREYLRDPSGGRRFWPIACGGGAIDTAMLKANIGQVWSEVLCWYRALRAHQPSGDLHLAMTGAAEKEALEMQESRRIESADDVLAGQIQAWLGKPIGADESFDDLDPEAPKAYRQATCTAQVWIEMIGNRGAVPQNEAMKIGRALRIAGWTKSSSKTTHSELREYGQCSVYRPD